MATAATVGGAASDSGDAVAVGAAEEAPAPPPSTRGALAPLAMAAAAGTAAAGATSAVATGGMEAAELGEPPRTRGARAPELRRCIGSGAANAAGGDTAAAGAGGAMPAGRGAPHTPHTAPDAFWKVHAEHAKGPLSAAGWDDESAGTAAVITGAAGGVEAGARPAVRNEILRPVSHAPHWAPPSSLRKVQTEHVHGSPAATGNGCGAGREGNAGAALTRAVPQAVHAAPPVLLYVHVGHAHCKDELAGMAGVPMGGACLAASC